MGIPSLLLILHFLKIFMLMDFLHCSCSLFSTVKLLIILVSFSDDWIYYINYFETQKKKNANEKIKPFFVYEMTVQHICIYMSEVQILLEKVKKILLLCSARKIVCGIFKCTYFVFIETIGLGFSKRGE